MQGTDDHRTTQKTGSGRQKLMSARDHRHLLRMEVKGRTASSRQLAASCSTATGVLMSACVDSLHPGMVARVPLYRIALYGKPSTAASAIGS
ncbi:hypothetical protein TNCV_422841 [Trichonephila clavipes]|nr:hypothetical protein TNCV_422841 [Trichonephila clavipes]